MRAELKQEMGIEKINPLRGSTIDDVYHDAKQQKSLIREQMAQQSEARSAELKKKQAEWSRKAMKRLPERAKKKMEYKAMESASKRKISI